MNPVARNILPLLRIGLAAVFVYAGILKVLDPSQFLADIESYRLLPYLAAVGTALYLPWLEICCGVALLFKRAYSGSLLILAALAGAFAVALGSAWWRGLDISCGCFGGNGSTANYPWLIARDLGIMTVLGVLVMAEWRRSHRPLPQGSTVTELPEEQRECR